MVLISMKIIYGNNSTALSGRIPEKYIPTPNVSRWAGISRAFSPFSKHRVFTTEPDLSMRTLLVIYFFSEKYQTLVENLRFYMG